jgi:hypothetical protein
MLVGWFGLDILSLPALACLYVALGATLPSHDRPLPTRLAVTRRCGV